MKNKISDLNDHLFEMLERLEDDEELDLEKEINRAKAMVGVADRIIQIGSLQVEAMRVCGEYGYKNEEVPELLAKKKSNKMIEA